MAERGPSRRCGGDDGDDDQGQENTKTTWTGCAEREPSQQAWHGLCMHLLQPLMPVMCSTHMHSFLTPSQASDEVAASSIQAHK